MRPSPPLPPKKEVALALLAQSSVFIHLDPRMANVVVPPMFKKQAQLVLQVGLNMPVPIPDLHLDEDGLSCTLSFSRSPFHCMVPWSAVYAMVNDEGQAMVWPDDVPPEVQQQARTRAETPAPPKKEGLRARPKLEEVPREGGARGRSPRAARDGAAAREGSREKGRGEGAQGKLTAVPSRPEKPAKPTPIRPEPKPEASREPPPVRVPKAPAPAPKKGKRELPPYLRVVK